MSINANKLKELAGEDNFRKAKKYYEDGFIEKFNANIKELPNINGGKILNITGKVISMRGFNTYDVKLEWDNVSNQVRGVCSCQNEDDEYSLRKPCSHMTALLIKYVKEYQHKLNISSSHLNEIDNLIEEIKHASNYDEDFKRELSLKVEFHKETYDMRPYIELKLGIDRDYSVRNMKSFIDSLIDKEPVTFGKNFTYDSSIYKFNKTDEKIMQMIIQVRQLEREKSDYYYNENYENNFVFSGKKFIFTNSLVCSFFNLVIEKEITAYINDKVYKNVKTIQGLIPFKFKIGMKVQDIELSQIDEGIMPIDEQNKVFFYNGSFYIPPEEQIKIYMPIKRMLSKRRNNKLTFYKKEGGKVASYIFPALSNISDEVVLDSNVKKIFKKVPLTIKTYLDKKENFIIASVKFNYDNIEISSLKDDSANFDKGILVRDVKKEENCDKILRSFGFEKNNDVYVMKKEKNIASFVTEGVKKLQEMGDVYYSENFKNIRVYGRPNIMGEIRLNSDNLLELNFKIDGVDDNELANIFNALKEKKKYYRLKNGDFVQLQDEGIKSMGEIINYLGVNDKDLQDEKMIISKYNALYIDQKIKDNNLDFIKRNENFKELVSGIKKMEEESFNLPEYLNKIMRNYQKTGFVWFKTLSHYGFGGILADEMGLGKTIQTIAFLISERGSGPSLVIVPTSLVYNWKDEIDKFGSELKTVIMNGTKSRRMELLKDISKSDVVITSYPLIRRDIDEFKDIEFNYCILDEAQQIKNASSINASSVKKIKARGYFALTGTPIENSLTELWSIFDFIMPGYLFNHSKFSKIYEKPIVRDNDKEALEELKRHINPFILRRLKKDVIKELPPKIEQKFLVEMTEEQKKVYAAYLNSARREINQEIKSIGFDRSRMKILSVLTRLRQICCDPSVFIENYRGKSGKMIALKDLLDQTISQGHRVLLFSQFTSVLKNISKMLDESQIVYMYLDGSTKSKERIDMVKKFNTGSTSVFLISLKAGGTGLNLTGADVVIHFDPWWNPAVEDQATDRAHRIGQKNTVEVIKLLSQGTIEEKIFNLQEKKKRMINDIINKDMNINNSITKMTQDELESLFL